MTGGAHGPVRSVTRGHRTGVTVSRGTERTSGRPHRVIVCASWAESPASTRDTPSAPPVASPQMAGRPTNTAVAPERQRGQHVRARADPAVGVDLHLVPDGVADLGQRGRAGDDRVGLPAAVRGDPHRRRAGAHALDRVVPAEHALDHDREAGQLGEPADVVERPGRALGGRAAGRRPRCPSAGRSAARRGWPRRAAGGRARAGRRSAPAPGSRPAPRPPGEVVGVGGGVPGVELEPLGRRRLGPRRRRPAGCWPTSTPSSALPRRPRRGRSRARRPGCAIDW